MLLPKETEARLGLVAGAECLDEHTMTVTLGIDDAAFLLDGMALTEVASAHLPWIEMVRGTTGFVTSELRSPWTQSKWLQLFAGSG